MAKCVGSVSQWSPEQVQLEDASFLVENVRQGEAAIKEMVQEAANGLLTEIGSTFTRIKQAALGEDESAMDSRQLQDALVERLKRLVTQSNSIIRCIVGAKNLMTSTKHAYFIQFTYGSIEKFHQLCQTIGRLSDIDQKLYLEEERKLLVSDESIAIHSLTSIWTAMLEILNCFCHQANELFNSKSLNPANGDDNDDMETYDYLDELEFSTTRATTAKMILMDLIVTSWIKFNRLVKYEDLVKSIPLLCPCHMKTFLRLLDGVAEWSPDKQDKPIDQLLCDLLYSLLDNERNYSMSTLSARKPGVIPLDPCYARANKPDLAYFIIWHLYALSSRAKSSTGRRMLANCQDLMEKAFKLVRASFIRNNGASSSASMRLSAHQEERYKLLFHMLNAWCELRPGHSHNAILLDHLFQFAHSIESLANPETKYFNNSDFSLNDSTLFQFCAKLMSETIPIYSLDGQTQIRGPGTNLTPEQRQLVASWNVLLDKYVMADKQQQQQPAPQQQPAGAEAPSGAAARPARPATRSTRMAPAK